MKSKIILLCIITNILFCSKSPKLNNDYLKKSSWEENYITLSFDEKNVFRVSGIAGGYLEGTFRIINDTLILQSSQKPSDLYNVNFQKLTCSLEKDNDDIYYHYYLVCNPGNARFGDSNSPVPAGQLKKLNGIPIVVLGHLSGKTKTEVRLREKPTTESKIIKFSPDFSSNLLPSIPAKTDLLVIGRTTDKKLVKDKNNYWYYVSALQHGPTFSLAVKGWMFGEFINIEKNK